MAAGLDRHKIEIHVGGVRLSTLPETLRIVLVTTVLQRETASAFVAAASASGEGVAFEAAW